MSEQWYLYQNQQQKGPYSLNQLKQAAGQGSIRREDMLWTKGMDGWIRADQVEGLYPPGQKAATTNAGPQYHSADDTKLDQLSSWLGFVSIMTIIGGVISAVSGLFAFIVGAIPGIITLIMGIKLRKAKKYADAMLAENDGALASANFEQFTDSLRSYFKIMGILIILGLIFSLLAIIFGAVASFMLPGLIENLTQMLG